MAACAAARHLLKPVGMIAIKFFWINDGYVYSSETERWQMPKSIGGPAIHAIDPGFWATEKKRVPWSGAFCPGKRTLRSGHLWVHDV